MDRQVRTLLKAEHVHHGDTPGGISGIRWQNQDRAWENTYKNSVLFNNYDLPWARMMLVRVPKLLYTSVIFVIKFYVNTEQL